MNLVGVAALALVAAEWAALGWVSNARWPGGGAATWATRLLVGAVLTAVAALVLALLGISFGLWLVVLAVAAAGAGALRFVGRTTCTDSAIATCPVDRRERIGWAVLGTVLMAAMVRAFVVPEVGWDAYSHWGLKALAYAQQGTIVDTHTVHEYYPPLVPLLEAVLYLERGAASIDLGKTVWALVGCAFAVVLTGHLQLLLQRAWLGPWVAAGVVLASTQLLEDFSTGQADLALTAFLTLATLSALQWLRQPRRVWLVQVGVFATAAALTKYEGLPRIAVVAAAIALEALIGRRRDAWRLVVVLLAAAVAGQALWVTYETTHGIAWTGEHVGALQLRALPAIVGELIAVFGGLRTGGALIVVIAAALVGARHAFKPPTRLLALVVLGQAAATLLAFLVSDTAADVEVRTAATRLVEQFMPVALVGAAVWLEQELIIRPWR